MIFSSVTMEVKAAVLLAWTLAVGFGVHHYDNISVKAANLDKVVKQDKVNDAGAVATTGILSTGDKKITDLTINLDQISDKWSDDRANNPEPVNCDKLPESKHRLLRDANAAAVKATGGAN